MIQDKFIGRWCFPKDDSLLEQSARRGGKYNFEVIADYIKDKMLFAQNDVVLDVCCGNAVIARRFAGCCKEIHGVDFSKEMIETAEKIKEQESISNLKLHLENALNIDKLFQENYFDKAYCYFSFQYFNRQKRFFLLKQLSRITKPDGWIFIGDIPDKTKKWNFYSNKKQYYRERISRLLQLKEGECGLGWWVEPEEISDWCRRKKLVASIILQPDDFPHAHYRFDVLIKNSK